MKRLVPDFILKKYSSKRFSGIINGTVMFLDIVGFTGITETLVKNGNEGAEVLSEIINNIFTPAIETIYRTGGFVASFAGDAYTAIFPANQVRKSTVVKSAVEIKNIFSNLKVQETKFGTFKLKVNIGLAEGKIDWRIIISEKLNSYYFKGQVLKEAILAEKSSDEQEIILTAELGGELKDFNLIKNKGYFILKDDEVTFEKKMIPIDYFEGSISPFIPETIINLDYKGQFRKIISCFISFDDNLMERQALEKIIRLTQLYGGYFNKIDCIDKGGIVLVLFGAPLTFEKDFLRACDFALEVMNIEDFPCKIGLTSGTVFTGFVGSKIRSEYTALGESVNLSARIVNEIEVNKIIIDQNIYQKAGNIYQVEFYKEQNLKGFSNKRKLYELINRKEIPTTFISRGELIGRHKQLQQILNCLKPLKQKSGIKTPNIIYVEGRFGVGKSRLIKEVKKNLSPDQYNWVYFPCDNILQKSFHPVLFFLLRLFKQSGKSKANDKRVFRRIYSDIISFCNNREIRQELIRLESFVGAVIDLSWQNSLYNRLVDKRIRYQNMILGLKYLFQSLCLLKPVIIEIEDAHWIDLDTINFLKTLFGDNSQYPFGLIASTESLSTEKRFDLELDQQSSLRIKLNNLNREETKQFSLAKLRIWSQHQDKLSPEIEKLIWERTNGNPFYIEQLIIFMVEKIDLDKVDVVKEIKFNVPDNINSLLVSRFDLLPLNMKTTVRYAAVIGAQFNLDLLENLMGKLDHLFVDMGCNRDIWIKISEQNYKFKNIYLRESIYQQLLKKDRKKMHLRLIKIIEKLYSKTLSEHFSDIAYHYAEAEDYSSAFNYLLKSAAVSKEKFRHETAIRQYHSALDLVEEYPYICSKADITNIILDILEVSLVQGNTNTASEYLHLIKPSELRKKNQNEKFSFLLIKYHILKGDFHKVYDLTKVVSKNIHNRYYSDYIKYYYLNSLMNIKDKKEFLQEARNILQKMEEKDDDFFRSRIKNLLGASYLRHSEYKKALVSFEESYKIVKKLANPILIRTEMHNLGIVYFRLGKKDKALGLYRESLKIAQKTGMEGAAGKLYSEIATINASQNKIKLALRNYNRALKISQRTGNKKQQGIVLYNISELYCRIKEYNRAVKFLEQTKEICSEISDREGLVYANDLEGDILFSLEKYQQAKKVYEKNLLLQKEIEDQEGICHTYGNLGNIAKVEGNLDLATNYYRYQQENLARIGDQEGEAKAYYNWALLDLEIKEYKSALEKLKKALELFKGSSYEKMVREKITEIRKRIKPEKKDR